MSHRHRLSHRTTGGVGVVGSRETPSYYPNCFTLLRNNRSIRNAVNAPFRDVLPDGFGATFLATPMVFNWCTTQKDRLISHLCSHTFFLCQPVFTIYPSCLT